MSLIGRSNTPTRRNIRHSEAAPDGILTAMYFNSLRPLLAKKAFQHRLGSGAAGYGVAGQQPKLIQ